MIFSTISVVDNRQFYHFCVVSDIKIYVFDLSLTVNDNVGLFVVHHYKEQFSIECRKTKTKVVTLTNHNKRRQSNEAITENSKQIHVAAAKRGKTGATKSRLVLFYF